MVPAASARQSALLILFPILRENFPRRFCEVWRLVSAPTIVLSALFICGDMAYAQAGGPRPSTKEPQALCTSDFVQIPVGGSVTIKITPTAQRHFYAFGSSAGTLVVNGNTALLNTIGLDATDFPITVVCSAVDADGRTVRASVNVSLAPMVRKQIIVTPSQVPKGYQFSGVLGPTLSWTNGTQTQTISGGTALLSVVRSASYCDAELRQFGIAANASDTSTAKQTGPTTALDNNDVQLNFTRGLPHAGPTDNYLGVTADYFGNNSLGIGLQQAYTVELQHYFSRCREESASGQRASGARASGIAGNPGTAEQGRDKDAHFFASVGVGFGLMNQRLYQAPTKQNSAIVPLTAQASYLWGEKSGLPPKLIVYGLLGFLSDATQPRAYQMSAVAGFQIPTALRWLTFNLSDSDLYMNNAPSSFKRNYQNGSVALVFTFPTPATKKVNPAAPASDRGACYGGDKLARLYCYDAVTADACAPPNLFRPNQVCASSGPVPTVEDQLR